MKPYKAKDISVYLTIHLQYFYISRKVIIVCMGMYNIIKFSEGCPNCDKKVEWQTKDLVIDNLYPVENILKIFKPNTRISGSVYTVCNYCQTEISAKINKGKLSNIKFLKK